MATARKPDGERTTSLRSPRGPYLGIAEAAEYLGVSRTTIWRLLEAHELPASKVGRWRKIAVADLELLMRRRRAS